jgi:hypothetical protein
LHSKDIPSINKRGIKSYMLVSYKPISNWRVEAKYSIVWYLKEESIGSGREKIQGNTKKHDQPTVHLRILKTDLTLFKFYNSNFRQNSNSTWIP